MCVSFVMYQLFVRALFRINFFFFKQKTAYEMRISDWSSDVCSSDLNLRDECRELPPPLGDPATITRWSATNLRDNQVQRGNVAQRQSNLRVALASVNQSRHHLKTATISTHPD